MELKSADSLGACRSHLERFFAAHPDETLQPRTDKFLRFIMAGDEPLLGRPEGWAAGIVYAAANWERRACGVPGLLNSELESFFGVSMGTIRRRAARVYHLMVV